MPHVLYPPNLMMSAWIMRQFPDGFSGYAVDVGASDGVSVNSTFGLERAGWTVLCIEPNPFFRAMLNERRRFVATCACGRVGVPSARFHVHEDNPEAYSALVVANHPKHHAAPDATWRVVDVEVKRLDRCLDDAAFPRLDALCVDTEGTEIDVLAGCDLARWRPKVVVAESWDADGPVNTFLERAGYRLVGRNVHNNLYLRRKEATP